MPKSGSQMSSRMAQRRLGGSPKAASLAPAHSNRTLLMRSIGGGCGQLEERRELRGCLELRDWVEVLERTREGVGQAPHCSWCELLDPRVEILVMNAPGQVFWGVELTFHECPVDDQFRCVVRQARPFPFLDLFPHRLEVPLHAVHPDREDVPEAQMLGVLGEHGREIAMKRHVVAYQHPVTDGEGEAHGLVVEVYDDHRESASVECGFEVEDSE